MKKDRQRKVQEQLVGIIFILILFLFLIINIIVPNKEKSVQENRMLATKPKFRLSSLISGDYDEKFEAYMDDQFVGRDMWRKLKVTVDRICGSRLENGVYIGRNGQLLEQIEVADENHLAANIKAIKSFSESQKKIPVRMMLVPDAANVLNHSLPALAKPEDQTQMFSMVRKDLGDSVEWIDVSTELNKHKTEKIYYKTDHHWTSEGAYLAYETWCDSTGMESTPLADLKKQVATKKFRGSLYSKILDADSAYDSIWTYGDTKQKTYGSDCSLTIDEKKQTDSCYDTAQLSQKDKYKYFFGDNYGTVQIVSDHARHQDRNLLVIKDSFANTFVPFATENYRQITMIDLRYYNGNVEEYMKEHQITDVLVLYNITNFISDRNLYKLVGRI